MSIYRLTAMQFVPPTKKNPHGGAPTVLSINCMLLNVLVPVTYRSEDGTFSIVILPGYHDNLNDFDYLDTVYQYYTDNVVEDVWYYRLAPSWWDWRPLPEGDDLSVPDYIFRPSPEGADLDKVSG